MKKWLSVLFAVLMIVSCFGAYAEGNKDISATLDVALAADMAPNSVTEWVRMFNEEYPNIKLNVTLVDASNYTATFEPLVAADAMPDVLAVAPHDYYRNLAEKGYLLDCGEEDGWDRQVSFVQDAYTSENGLRFGVSNGVSTLVLYYNEDHFEKAGITELPTCWEEFLECCDKLKAAGFAPLAVAGAGSNNLGHSFMGFGIAYEVYGSGYDKEWVKNVMGGEYDYDVDAWKRVLERLAYLRDKEYFQKGYESADLYEVLRLLAAGEASMSVQQTSQAGNIFLDNGVRLNCMPVPWNYRGQPNVAISWPCDGVGLGRNDNNEKNLEAAKIFFNYVTYENAWVYQNMVGGLSPFLSTEDMPKAIVDNRIQAAWEVNAQLEQSGLPAISFPAPVYAQARNFVQEVALGLAEPDMIGEYLNAAQAEYAATLK